MKLILWSVVIAMTLTIIYLTGRMAERPFTREDMTTSFYNGCMLGLKSTQYDYCVKYSKMYSNGLEKLLDQ